MALGWPEQVSTLLKRSLVEMKCVCKESGATHFSVITVSVAPGSARPTRPVLDEQPGQSAEPKKTSVKNFT